MMRIVSVLLVLTGSGRAATTPCTPFERAQAGPALHALTKAAARHLHAPRAELIQAFREGRWRMAYVDTHRSDQTVVLYSGSRYVTNWSGAARQDEADELRTWLHANAPGVPDGLARCFAWFVTEGRTR